MFTSRPRAWVTTLAVTVAAMVGAAGIASAASHTSSSKSSSGSTSTARPMYGTAAFTQDPAKMTHGPGETLLTGTAASKARAAALAAVPGATVIRVETDSAGAAYEAHLTKADGSQVTIKLDSGFKVTATQNGFGSPPSH
jgi:hypothetical protein